MDNDKLKLLRRPLQADEIEFRVQSVNKGGYATILAYKDARADQNRLDEVFGPLGWQRSHSNGNANCVVSVWSDDIKQWVGKEDVGTPSNTESAKGLASDSFKRACFNWGIGRELYDYPEISIKLNQDEYKVDGNKAKQTWNLRLKEWRWKAVFKERQIVSLAAMDNHGNIRFNWVDGEFERLMASFRGLYETKDSEGFLAAFESLQKDEQKMDAIWRSLDSKTRSGMKEMLADERKARDEEEA